MADELTSVIEMFHSFKKSGRSATLTMSTKGGQATKVKLEVELDNATFYYFDFNCTNCCLDARQLGIATDPMVQPEGEQRPMLEQPSIGSFKLFLSQKALVMRKACLVHLHRDVLYNTILLPLLRVDERS